VRLSSFPLLRLLDHLVDSSLQPLPKWTVLVVTKDGGGSVSCFRVELQGPS
jgi:hypothetical protein